MYTWNGTAWSGFQLGNNALAAISAEKITAGSLAAGVIVTSNLSAGQINTGVLNGITVQTSPSGNRIAMTNTDETFTRFVTHPPAESWVCEINWSDNPWFPEELDKERRDWLDRDPTGYLLNYLMRKIQLVIDQ